LIDITPKSDGETRILFLPDLKLVWEGKRYPNHFAPLLQWREVTDWLAASQRIMNMTKPEMNTIRSDELLNAQMQLAEAVKRLEKRYLRHRK